VIQQQVKLQRAFAGTDASPLKALYTEFDHAGIQAQELVLKAELVFGSACPHTTQKLIEDPFVKLPGPVSVGIGQGRAPGCLLQSQVS